MLLMLLISDMMACDVCYWSTDIQLAPMGGKARRAITLQMMLTDAV